MGLMIEEVTDRGFGQIEDVVNNFLVVHRIPKIKDFFFLQTLFLNRK